MIFSQKGNATFVALGVTSVLLVSAAGAGTIISSTLRESPKVVNSSKALFAAEGAIESALYDASETGLGYTLEHDGTPGEGDAGFIGLKGVNNTKAQWETQAMLEVERDRTGIGVVMTDEAKRTVYLPPRMEETGDDNADMEIETEEKFLKKNWQRVTFGNKYGFPLYTNTTQKYMKPLGGRGLDPEIQSAECAASGGCEDTKSIFSKGSGEQELQNMFIDIFIPEVDGVITKEVAGGGDSVFDQEDVDTYNDAIDAIRNSANIALTADNEIELTTGNNFAIETEMMALKQVLDEYWTNTLMPIYGNVPAAKERFYHEIWECDVDYFLNGGCGNTQNNDALTKNMLAFDSTSDPNTIQTTIDKVSDERDKMVDSGVPDYVTKVHDLYGLKRKLEMVEEEATISLSTNTIGNNTSMRVNFGGYDSLTIFCRTAIDLQTYECNISNNGENILEFAISTLVSSSPTFSKTLTINKGQSGLITIRPKHNDSSIKLAKIIYDGNSILIKNTIYLSVLNSITSQKKIILIPENICATNNTLGIPIQCTLSNTSPLDNTTTFQNNVRNSLNALLTTINNEFQTAANALKNSDQIITGDTTIAEDIKDAPLFSWGIQSRANDDLYNYININSINDCTKSIVNRGVACYSDFLSTTDTSYIAMEYIENANTKITKKKVNDGLWLRVYNPKGIVSANTNKKKTRGFPKSILEYINRGDHDLKDATDANRILDFSTIGLLEPTLSFRMGKAFAWNSNNSFDNEKRNHAYVRFGFEYPQGTITTDLLRNFPVPDDVVRIKATGEADGYTQDIEVNIKPQEVAPMFDYAVFQQ